MVRIPQRTQTDCGIAAVAMIAGVTYEQAREAFQSRRRSGRTNTKDCIKALRRLGTKPAAYARHGEIDDILALPHRALVKVNRRRKNWHWVAYDPAVGLVDPANCSQLTPYSYLAVTLGT